MANAKAVKRKRRLEQEKVRARCRDEFMSFAQRGQDFQGVRQFKEAIRLYRRAIEVNPSHKQAAVVLTNLGQCYLDLGELAEAEAWARRAVSTLPTLANAHATLGAIHDRQRRREEGAEALWRAVTLDPTEPFFRVQLSRVLLKALRLDEGIAQIREAIRLQPKYSEHWRELAEAFYHADRRTEADDALRRAIDLDPVNYSALSTRGLWRLREGDYERGWPEADLRDDKAKCNVSPEWRGASLRGKTVMVLEEGGLGDALQYARYLPVLTEMGTERVYYLGRPELITLLDRSHPSTHYIYHIPTGVIPKHDYHIPCQSLGYRCGSTLETIPPPLRLVPDAERVEFWRAELERLSLEKRAVGIYWRGNATFGGDYTRSMEAETLAPLVSVPGVQCFSLQIGSTPPAGVIDLALRLTSLDETAAVVSSLDLLIGVDSMLGHMAGCLGVPAWVLLPALADWRWLDKRTDSPWYPTTHRLFRQSRIGDWSGPVEGICQALREFACSSTP